MGNASSANNASGGHRQKSHSLSQELSTPNSPHLPQQGAQAFSFDKKPDTRSVLHGDSTAREYEEASTPYYTKPVGNNSSSVVVDEFAVLPPQVRKRSSTISEGSVIVNKAKSNLSSKESSKEHNDNDDDDCEDDGDRNEVDSEKESEANMDEEQQKNPALPTVLRWDGGGKNVMISGTFSKWKPIPMVRSHGNFVTIIDLPEGEHQYKFCVDGQWKHDPKVKCVETEDGIKNNLVSVRQSDFEVFQALAKDSENIVNTAEKEYSQDVPQAKPWEKVSGPPVLPPHLLQVILNKDTPLSCEPTLLPEPNHVMLNHLYALSIKDGVMVLSATHRYRKKYVTTLLYKPI